MPMPTSRGIAVSYCAAAGRARRWPGLAMLVPGAPQWLWHQRERAILLGGSYAAALGVGAFAWGTAVGAVLVAFAYAVHVASAADAIAQWAFPGFGRRVPTTAAALALGVGIYGPLAVLGALVAWPGVESHGPRAEFAVDRLAYRGEGRTPGRGDYVWLAPRAAKSRGRLARVLARPGDEVAWSRGRLEVDGRRVPLAPFRPGQDPESLAFTVPDGHLLVAYQTDDPLAPRGWELVPAGRVEGRAWAQLYPIWDRRLLN
jgi:hypothetical protein